MDGFTYLSTAQLVANASQPVFFTCMLRYFPATDEFPFVTTSQQWQRTSGYDSDDDNGSNSNATMQRRMNATDNERTNNGQRTNERTNERTNDNAAQKQRCYPLRCQCVIGETLKIGNIGIT